MAGQNSHKNEIPFQDEYHKSFEWRKLIYHSQPQYNADYYTLLHDRPEGKLGH